MIVACWSLFVGRVLWFGVVAFSLSCVTCWCLLFVACCEFVVCWLLLVVRCCVRRSLVVVGCVLYGICCGLFVVGRCWMLVVWCFRCFYSVLSIACFDWCLLFECLFGVCCALCVVLFVCVLCVVCVVGVRCYCLLRGMC